MDQTAFEPAIILEVKEKNHGTIYVGRQHTGKIAHIYFEKKEE